MKGWDLFGQVRCTKSFDECANTDVQAVFDLILRTVIKNRLEQADLPAALYFVSDIEFDFCAGRADLTNFEHARRAFASRGYKLPRMAFRNVTGRALQQPVTMSRKGAALVSGCTPRLFEMVLGENLSPCAYMPEILSASWYRDIAA